MAKLESKVRELEKQQVTILATPLPEESKRNLGLTHASPVDYGGCSFIQVMARMGLVLVCGRGCDLEVLAFSFRHEAGPAEPARGDQTAGERGPGAAKR
jgi:hypothetical protein